MPFYFDSASALHNGSPSSPLPLRVVKPGAPAPAPISTSTPAPAPTLPPRAGEDNEAHLRAAILSNAAFLFPRYEFAAIRVATGLTPFVDGETAQTNFALVYASEASEARKGGEGREKRVVEELLKSSMTCSSRRRALEGLLVVSEVAVGMKVGGVVEEGDGMANIA